MRQDNAETTYRIRTKASFILEFVERMISLINAAVWINNKAIMRSGNIPESCNEIIAEVHTSMNYNTLSIISARNDCFKRSRRLIAYRFVGKAYEISPGPGIIYQAITTNGAALRISLFNIL